MYTFYRKANYYETDRMGVVHHSNYIRWFEEARIGLLEHLDIPYDKMEAAGIWIPVLSAQCSYKHPIRFGEEIALTLRIRAYNGVRFTIEYEGYHTGTGKRSCTGKTEHCFTTPDLRPIRMQKRDSRIHQIFLDFAKVSEEEE